jgi:hypothetical protein
MNCVRRNGLRPLGLGTFLMVLGGCAADRGLPELSSNEISAPPGPDSGEPFLSSLEGTVYLSWLERVGERHELRMARLGGEAWDVPITIEASNRFFVNWADFPSVSVDAGGILWAHWLERGHHGGYGVRVVRSADAGASWSEPWVPHQDTSATEHGFVATLPMDGGRAFAWLDGRAFASGDRKRAETALYFRAFGAGGPVGPELPIDARVCDCCQTDAATTADGAVLVYRDRSPDEIRDIHAVRWSDGAWTESVAVHEDGWETGACPVNGPAVDAGGDRVAVAWFTAAGEIPRVKIAFSDDGGRRFGEPVVIDDGDPAGRVDVVLLADGAALVGWLERTGGDRADVRVKYVTPSGRTGESLSVSASTSARASGFARMARLSDGRVVIAWTDVTAMQPRVRVANVVISGDGTAP